MTSSRPRSPVTRPPQRVALVGLAGGAIRRARAEQSMDELAGLAAAAGGRAVLRVLQDRQKPDPATFLGRGKIRTLGAACAEAGVELVVFDNELSPAQLRNLEAALDVPVVDRTQLILDIFARRARTREGRLQVELAQLQYLLPRLVGAREALSRLGGGIGTRGPGETKLETDRRKIRQRIDALTREIDAVRRRREQSRERRRKAAIPTVALVGYTNAGKTTLFTLLTGQTAAASDALFVTLDPLVRQVRSPGGGEFLLTDTVGFIDRLPMALVAAFRATLEEVAQADLLLHVIDASSADRARHRDAVRRTLEEVGAGGVDGIEVYNKCDLLDAKAWGRLHPAPPGAVCISALRGTGRRELLEAIETRLALDSRRVTLVFDEREERDRRRLAQLYRHARVLRHVAQGPRVAVEADVPMRLLSRLRAGAERRARIG